jgi:hypothetical protein
VQECRSPKKEGLDQEGNPQELQQQGQVQQQQGQRTQPPAYSSSTKGNSKPVGSANVVTDPGEEDDGVWTVMMVDNADASKDTKGDEAVIAAVEETRSAWVKLYDSGATCHISPYCDDFETYLTLNPPQYLHAANKQQFPAVSTGQIHVSMLNCYDL